MQSSARLIETLKARVVKLWIIKKLGLYLIVEIRKVFQIIKSEVVFHYKIVFIEKAYKIIVFSVIIL